MTSGFKYWEQLNHSEDYLIYPEIISKNISIDELSLSKRELYTFVTNKSGRRKKKTLIADVKGTKSQYFIYVLNKIPLEKRKLVNEITLDMANNMLLISRMYFPENALVTDRFQVVKLVIGALQYLRIKY
jgi:transposase